MTKRPRPPHHNHTTRDIKPLGVCPACDRYWDQVSEREASQTPTDPRVEAAEMQIAAARPTNCSSKNLAIAAIAAADAVDPLRQPSIISPDCRDANHHKCHGDAWDEAHDHITECQCSCHTPAASIADVIIGRNLTGLLPGHTCVRPGPGYPLGVIWQCLLCKATYRMESVRDRGISQNEWTTFEVTP